MRYAIEQTTRFRKQLKQMKKRHLDVRDLAKVVDTLAAGEALDARCRNHRLTDSKRFQDCWECHIAPDWLLVYRKYERGLILLLIETGTHSDLFDK